MRLKIFLKFSLCLIVRKGAWQKMKKMSFIFMFLVFFSFVASNSWAKVTKVTIMDGIKEAKIVYIPLPELVVYVEDDGQSTSAPKPKVTSAGPSIPQGWVKVIHTDGTVWQSSAFELQKQSSTLYKAAILLPSVVPNDKIKVTAGDKNTKVDSQEVMIRTKSKLIINNDAAIRAADDISLKVEDQDESNILSDVPSSLLVMGTYPIMEETMTLPIDLEQPVLHKDSSGNFTGVLKNGMGESKLDESAVIGELFFLNDINAYMDSLSTSSIGDAIVGFNDYALNLYLKNWLNTEFHLDIVGFICDKLSFDDAACAEKRTYQNYLNMFALALAWKYFEPIPDSDGVFKDSHELSAAIFTGYFVLALSKKNPDDIKKALTDLFKYLDPYLRQKFSIHVDKIRHMNAYSFIELFFENIESLVGVSTPQAVYDFLKDIVTEEKMPGIYDYLNNAGKTPEEVQADLLKFLDIAEVLMQNVSSYHDIIGNFLTLFNHGAGPTITAEMAYKFLVRTGIIDGAIESVDLAKFADALEKTLVVIMNTKAMGDNMIYLQPKSVIFGFYQDPKDDLDFSIIKKDVAE